MKVYNLKNWSVCGGGVFFSGFARLYGERAEDKQEVLTSQIAQVNGRFVITKSGSVYILHNISDDYLQWMKSNHIDYDEEEPLKGII